MDRRMFLGALFAASALSLQACAAAPPEAERLPRPKPSPAAPAPTAEAPKPVPSPEPPAPPQYVPTHDLPGGPLWELPADVGNRLAWTVDDGASPEVVMAYARFAQETGTRLTFFVTGMYADSWAPAAAVLAPLIASGQVQIANHTFWHSSLTNIGDAEIQSELMQGHDFIQQTFGVDARPWYRPPYGNRDARTDAAAAAIGYTQPVMWYGSLGDSGLIQPEIMMQEADKWLQPARIVLGHANAPTVTGLFPQLTAILANRGIEAVTLNDVFRTA